jgi:hypothetical protein
MMNSRKTNRRPIRHFDIGENIIGSLAIDICRPIKYHNRNHFFVVGIERISRFLWTLLLPSMPQSQELVNYVKGINKVLAIRTVLTDQGSQFTSGTWLKELSGMGIGVTKSSLTYSQTNDISEMVIQTVQEKIRTDYSGDSLKKKTANAT